MNELLSRLNSITWKQEDFAKEISGLREEMLKITRAANQAEEAQPFADSMPEKKDNDEEATEAEDFNKTPVETGER